MSGIKHDAEKPDMSLLSSKALVKIAEIMTFGKKKYSANNWRGGIAYSRLIAAAMRHIAAWNDGESLDPESGKSHLAHASCCLMMLLEFETTRPDLDDRYKAGEVAPKEPEQLSLFRHAADIVLSEENKLLGRLANDHYEDEQKFQNAVRSEFIFERE